MKIILHLCADIGSDSKPYADDPNYLVLKIGKDIGVENYIPDEDIYGVIANPVCTEFSIASGFHKNGDIDKGMFLVNHCKRIIDICNPVFWVIENPASGRLKNYLGEPDFVYEPWQFGSPWTKKTALWGVFNKPKKVYQKWEDVPKINGLYCRPGRGKPSLAFMHKSHKRFIHEWDSFQVEDDMSFRSLCSQKFAMAFKQANP